MRKESKKKRYLKYQENGKRRYKRYRECELELIKDKSLTSTYLSKKLNRSLKAIENIRHKLNSKSEDNNV